MARTRNALQAPNARAGRWLAGSISLGAGFATILASAHSCGVIGDASASRRTLAALGVHWIGLTPAADTAYAIGDTVRFIAAVTDRHGTALVGAWLDWASSDTAVAAVDSTGVVAIRGSGTAIISASAGDKVAQGRVVVRQQAVRVAVSDSALQLGEATGRVLVATPLDARGHPARAIPVRWTSADTSVAAVDSVGTVRGVGAGEVLVTARVDTIEQRIPVVVTPLPHRLVVVAGDSQSAPAGRAVPDAVAFRVESRRGHPLGGVPVRFTLRDGGSVRVARAASDSLGEVRASWTLGPRPGEQRLVAQVDGLEPETALTALAEPAAGNVRVTAMVGDTVEAGSTSVVAVHIRVTDSLGRLLPGLPVTWTAGDSGSITPRSPRTDSLGESHALWSPGPRAGTQHAVARIGSGREVPPTTLTLHTRAGAPAHLLGVDGHGQKGHAGGALPRPLTIKVVDRFRNGVPGIPVTATVSSGMLRDSTLVTDSAGLARFRWTLGPRMGQQQAVVRAGRLPALTATVHAAAGPPAVIQVLSASESGRAGKPLARPVRLVILDAWGNRVTDRQVTFTASAGTVTPSRAMPNADGVLTTTWKLGSKPGMQTLTTSVRGTAIRTVLEVRAGR
jgi:adhesin/invasin